jgi:reactive intermediate/imine deaminase
MFSTLYERAPEFGIGFPRRYPVRRGWRKLKMPQYAGPGFKQRFLMSRRPIQTDHAPAAIGTYSQAIEAGGVVYLSGQIPLDPATMEMVPGDTEIQIRRVLDNLEAVARAAGGGLGNMLKLTVYLIDLGDFAVVNQVMEDYFQQPYPARAAVQVSALPRGARVEIDAIMQV